MSAFLGAEEDCGKGRALETRPDTCAASAEGNERAAVALA